MQTLKAQPNVIAFDIKVEINSGQAGEVRRPFEQPFGIGEPGSARVDVFGLLADVVEQSSEQLARIHRRGFYT